MTFCPVCKIEKVDSSYVGKDDVTLVMCAACGPFYIEREVRDDYELAYRRWNVAARALLSHALRRGYVPRSYANTDRPILTSQLLSSGWFDTLELPSRIEQFEAAIRMLGDFERQHGEVPDRLPDGTWALLGTLSPKSCAALFDDMANEGVINSDVDTHPTTDSGSKAYPIHNARLTLSGWRRWQRLKEGDSNSLAGFIAMQFGTDLEPFFERVIQTNVANILGVPIRRVDSPDVMRADVIDNILREQIESCSFVICEIEKGNRGAYWEAGLAEGLGKPVIYVCSQSFWESPPKDLKPHFDVNHRTTVMWGEDEDEFAQKLAATITNSLRYKKQALGALV